MTAPSTDALPESFIPANAVSTITGIQKEAAEKCIKNHIPFVLYAERPEEEYTFYADYPCNHDSDADEFGVMTKEGMKQMKAEEGKRKFYVGFFDQQESPVIIKEKLNAEEVLTTDFKTPSVLRNPVIRQKCSTIQMVFQSQVFAIKSRLKADHVSGKVVLSKVVSTASERPIFEVIEEYFKSTPSVLRAVYYHPLTGLWVVATPEVLFKYNKSTHDFATMALAGTRPTPADGPWNTKNIKEHKYVVRHILDLLKEFKIKPIYPQEPLTLPLGVLEHLCTPIRGNRQFTKYQFESLICDLSPTPAVAGYPREYALNQISALELHNRYCYGGWLGPDKGEEVNFYVNLRSALLFPEYDDRSGEFHTCFYNIYAGGGILAQSKPKEEWEETELKCMTLRKIIGGLDFSAELSPDELTNAISSNPKGTVKKPHTVGGK